MVESDFQLDAVIQPAKNRCLSRKEDGVLECDIIFGGVDRSTTVCDIGRMGSKMRKKA